MNEIKFIFKEDETRWEKNTNVNYTFSYKIIVVGKINQRDFFEVIEIENTTGHYSEDIPGITYKTSAPNDNCIIHIFTKKLESNDYINCGCFDVYPTVYVGTGETPKSFVNTKADLRVLVSADGFNKKENAKRTPFYNFEANAEQYSRILNDFLRPLLPRILGKYSSSFAKLVHLFKAPSDFLFSDGRQVNVNPLLHFSKHHVFQNELLEHLAEFAYETTFTIYTEKPSIDTFSNFAPGQVSVEHAVFLTDCFSRYLCLLSNLIEYEYDYVFGNKPIKKQTIGDLFSDSLLSFTGDCEDASRINADMWRSTLGYDGENQYVDLFKKVQLQFRFYCGLCTIKAQGDMAHCTCFILPREKTGKFPFAIVEGTNMISSFSAAELLQHQLIGVDYKKLEQMNAMVEFITKGTPGERVLNGEYVKKIIQSDFNGTIPYTFLFPNPHINLPQARTSGSQNVGQAKSKDFFGAFHDVWEILSDGVKAYIVTYGKKLYGATAKEIMESDEVEFSPLPVELPKDIAAEYKRLTSWRNEKQVMNFKIDSKSYFDQSQIDDSSERFPIWLVFRKRDGLQMEDKNGLENRHADEIIKASDDVKWRAKIAVGDTRIYNLEIKHINEVEEVREGSRVMALAEKIMAPVGVNAQRKLYPCSDSSEVAAVAARFQEVTGTRLQLKPHVDVATLVHQAIGAGEKAAPIATAAPVAAHPLGKKAPPIATTPRVAAHPFDGVPGDILQALAGLKIGVKFPGESYLKGVKDTLKRETKNAKRKLKKVEGEFKNAAKIDMAEDLEYAVV
jgi:hypothetical protein